MNYYFYHASELLYLKLNSSNLEIILNWARNFMSPDIKISAIKSRSLKQDLVFTRYLYMKYAKENTRYTLEKIGKFVNRDHATVLHGINTINNEVELSKLYTDFTKYICSSH